MILNLQDTSKQDRYIPDVIGYNFSVLMPDPWSAKQVRQSIKNSAFGLSGLRGASIENLSGGPSTAFKVGDSWRVSITGGPANAPVYLNANLLGVPMPKSGEQDLALSAWLGRYTQGLDPIGTTDASGNFTASGTFTPQQVGSWTQLWNVQGQLMPLPQFTVADASGSTQYTGPTTPGGTAYYTLASNHPAAQQYTADELTAMSQVPASQTQASTATNKPNQSVPPNTQLTTIPSLPAGPSTRQVLTSAYYDSASAGSAGGQSGLDGKTLAFGAAALLALFLVMQK